MTGAGRADSAAGGSTAGRAAAPDTNVEGKGTADFFPSLWSLPLLSLMAAEPSVSALLARDVVPFVALLLPASRLGLIDLFSCACKSASTPT